MSILSPSDQILIHAPLQDQIFDRAADWIVDQSRGDGGTQEEGAHALRYTRPTLPYPQRPCGANTIFARIEPEHDLTQADASPTRAARYPESDTDFVHGCSSNVMTVSNHRLGERKCLSRPV
jgi:hypothetical protein